MKTVVIGAGIMGLAAGIDLQQRGHRVQIFESGPEPGGLAGSFDFGGVRAEKFYHFVCGADEVYFRWLKRLGLFERLRWRETQMGLVWNGSLRRFGDPMSLLGLRALSPWNRLRYGFHMWSAQRLQHWKPLESEPAVDWLVRHEGEQAYRVIWEPLLTHKFGSLTPTLSAAWIWSRIRRLASSRDFAYREKLGYLDGGTDIFVRGLVDAFQRGGGDLVLNTPVEGLVMDERGQSVAAVRAGGADVLVDGALSTAPLPILRRFASNLPRPYLEQTKRLPNLGVRCLLLKLREPLTHYFWINVNDPGLPICGLIEYTNLHPVSSYGCTLVYSPHYVHSDDPEYSLPDEEVMKQTVHSIQAFDAQFDEASILDYRVFRAPYAQPFCPVGFTGELAPLETGAQNFVAADTTHLLPHDRSISDTLALSERLTAAYLGLLDAGPDRASPEGQTRSALRDAGLSEA